MLLNNVALAPTITNSGFADFTFQTVQFVGTGGSATLKLQMFSGGGYLDDVSVQSISPPQQQIDSGTIVYNDPNGGVPAATFAALGIGDAGGYVGTFSIGQIDGNSVEWNFAADNSALQFLGANQTVTQTYAVTLTDSYGATDTENVTVTLHGVNDAPVITSNGGDIQFFSIPENTTAVTTIAVFDADVGDTRTWSLAGVDASKFDISSAGVITFKTAPDIENPSDSGGNWTYDLIVKVTDSAGAFDRQQLVVYLIDRDDAPSGANNNIQITEDVTYTFNAADFGFSDVDGDQFAGVVVNTSPDSAHGYLLRGGFAVNAGDTISAAEIAAGMLTYVPVQDRFNGQGSFDFSVRDTGASGDGNLNTDQSPNTMRMTFTGGDRADNEVSGIPNFNLTFEPSVLYGFQSFRDPYNAFQADSDLFVWNQLGGGGFNRLEMSRTTDDLQISFNATIISGDTRDGVFTIYNQYEPGFTGYDSAIEQIYFSQPMQFGSSQLSGMYNLEVTNNGGGGNDILVGNSGFNTLNGGGGQDVLFGAGGFDTLNGDGGNDILVGGLGNDTLTGGAGMDTYRFAESGSAHRDTILDYDIADQEKLDLSALLDASFGAGSNVSDFVRVLDSGNDAIVQVDTNGASGGANWQDVAVLSNYGAINNTVLVHFEQQTQQLQVA